MSPTKTSTASESSAPKANPRTQKGLANEEQPTWAPPESQPEPRPADPILRPSPAPNPPDQAQAID